MEFMERFEKLKQRIARMSSTFPDMTEEATKNALIMPFFTILGYDVFDPMEFVPEFVCDVGTKKGEKIDYAIMSNGEPIILIEAKRAGMKLQKQQQSQLYRYFAATRSRIAILTNGTQYNIYSDINTPNVMDDDPFLSFNILTDDPSLFMESLQQFCKENLDINTVLSKAVYLKYFSVVEKTFKKDLQNPSDELVKYFLSCPEIYTGKRITSHTIGKYREITAQALRKVMGVTLNVSVQEEQEEAEQFVQEENIAEINLNLTPDKYKDVENVMSGLEYTYSVDNKLHTFACDGFRVCANEAKPNRYIVFVGNPSKIVFVKNIKNLEEVINRLK